MFNSPADLVATFQEWVAAVPEWVQPVITAIAGAVPFVEGEGGVTIGIVGGMNPVVAGVSAAIGNFLCVAVVVWLSAGARTIVVDRVRTRSVVHAPTGAGSGASDGVHDAPATAAAISAPASPREARQAARQNKFQSALSKYGVPGVSLMGPLLLPTMFTAAMLAAVGVSRSRVLLWQGAAIVLWTTIFAVMMTLLIGAVSAQ